jgi:hypothetical protein
MTLRDARSTIQDIAGDIRRRRGLGPDEPAVMRSISIDGRAHLIVGIMPADFRFPRWDTEVWRPVDYFSPPPAQADDLPGVYVRWAKEIPSDVVSARAADVMRTAGATLATRWVELNPLATWNRDECVPRSAPLGRA